MPRLLTLIKQFSSLLALIALATPATHAEQSQQLGPATQTGPLGTKVILLGTGHPDPNPDRQGPALAIVVNGSAYIVDAGPGVMRQTMATVRNGHPELIPPKLSIAFLTHLHSDHTLGLPDLIQTSWIMGRTAPFEIYGPPGTRAMVDHMHAAWIEDIKIRTEGFQKTNNTGHRSNVHEIAAGVIYQDDNIKVTAIPVPHGDWAHAYGFRFDTADRSIVISGDTAPSEAIAAACNPCDLLIHEVYTRALAAQPIGARIKGMNWKAYFSSFHTSTDELAELAAKTRPGLLLLTHYMMMNPGDEGDLVSEIRSHYSGPLAVGVDLGVY